MSGLEPCTEWDIWAEDAEHFVRTNDPNAASVLIFKMIGHILENPCSQEWVNQCRRLIDDFLVTFADWDKDD